MSDSEELTTMQNVAKKTQVTEQTIRNWIKKGYIKSVRLPSGHHRIPKAELNRLLTDYFDFGVPVTEGSDEPTLVPVARVEELQRFIRHIIAHGDRPLDDEDIQRAKDLLTEPDEERL